MRRLSRFMTAGLPVVALMTWPGHALAATTTYVVTNTNDSGAGSLRAAIMDSNAHPKGDRITFNISGAAPHTISVGSALPTITSPAVIDATTEPGYAGSPVIQIDGSTLFDVPGLEISAGSSTVLGLDVTNFGGGNGVDPFQGLGIELDG